MIIDSIDKFVAIIPTAEGSEWSSIEPYMKDAEAWAKSDFLGDDLFAHIVGLASGNVFDALTVLLANKAYQLAIPFVDLVQTPTGFAVVNNTNQLPASQQRVDRLMQTATANVGLKVSSLIRFIEADKELLILWAKADAFERITSTIFWRPEEMSQFGILQATSWDAMIKNYPAMIGFQTGILADWISIGYMNELIAKRRSGTLTDEDKKALNLVQLAVISLLAGNAENAEKTLVVLVNYMEKQAASFATYIDSDVYSIKISAKYQNQKSDPTFFFN